MSEEQTVARFRAGQFPSKEEATRQLVADILRERMGLGSRTLTDRICEQLRSDPSLHRALERLWGDARVE